MRSPPWSSLTFATLAAHQRCRLALDLGVGCSDPYGASLKYAVRVVPRLTRLGESVYRRFPIHAANHTGHTHTGTSHRVLVEMSDLNTTLNTGATYFAEAQYVTPHEYAWCQAHPGQCNMYNNVSYRQFNVTGTTIFTFSAVGTTVRMKPAIEAWTGATMNAIRARARRRWSSRFIAYKVTNPSAGVWHYEYAIYNQNLDRAIQILQYSVRLRHYRQQYRFSCSANHPGFRKRWHPKQCRL